MRMKGFIALCTVFFLLMSTMLVSAESNASILQPSKPTEGVESPYKNYAYGKIENLNLNIGIGIQSYQYFQMGDAFLYDLGNGKVQAYGRTKASQVMDTIGVGFTLQRYENNQWKNYMDLGGASVSLSNETTATSSATVPKGYNYRILASHWVSKNGNYETASTITSYIKIE